MINNEFMPESLQTPHSFDPSALQISLADHYRISLQRLEESLSTHQLHEKASREFISFLRTPGKMMRSLFLLGSYMMGKGRDELIPDGVYKIAVAQEIFHNFTLIHDDVIDASSSRRGQPTLHYRFAGLTDGNVKDGENLAIVFGDILFGYCLDVIMSCQDLPPSLLLQTARYFSQTVQSTGCGQAMEMLNQYKSWAAIGEEEIEQVYYLKTSRYTIESPVVIGQLLGGRLIGELGWVERFARPLGMAFQMENDLHEIRILPTENWRLAYDIFTGVKTIYNHRLLSQLAQKDRDYVEKLFAQPDLMANLGQEELLRLFYDPKVLSLCEEEISSCLVESFDAIEQAALSLEEKSFLRQLVSNFTKKLEHSES